MEPLEKSVAIMGDDVKHKDIVKTVTEADEMWTNSKYTVSVRRDIKTPMSYQGEQMLMTHISFKRKDNGTDMDWREMQWIKNQICGDECEGVDIFPAESRLVDGANQYHIWVFQNTEFKLPFGFPTRMVTQKKFFGETQRPFREGRVPSDLKKCEDELDAYIQEIKDNPDVLKELDEDNK